MKKTILFLLLACIIICVNAQPSQTALSANDEYVKQLGALENLNVATIADTISRKFIDKKDKARAIYFWIANNISLDPKATRSNDNKKADPVIVIQERKTTPLGFANLVQEMCSMANIRCLVVDGFVKKSAEEINNKADEINYSWNVVQLGQSPDKWYYIDAASAAGFLDKKMSVFTRQFITDYFFADKALFNLSHYPDNSGWYLGNDQKSLKEFYALPIIGRSAFAIGLQKPLPLNGFIKAKKGNNVSFSFNYNPGTAITDISIVIGEGSKQLRPDKIDFTDNGGSIKFNYKFKKDDTYPFTIMADGKEILRYYAEIEE